MVCSTDKKSLIISDTSIDNSFFSISDSYLIVVEFNKESNISVKVIIKNNKDSLLFLLAMINHFQCRKKTFAYSLTLKLKKKKKNSKFRRKILNITLVEIYEILKLKFKFVFLIKSFNELIFFPKLKCVDILC